MNWKDKALLQSIFSAIPGGEALNYLIQRHVIKSLPIDDSSFKEYVRIATEHIEALRNFFLGDLNQARFFEFGAGWDMSTAFAFYSWGISRQILADVRVLIRPLLINDTISKFGRVPLNIPLPRIPARPIPSGEKQETLSAIREFYGIEYRAPCDARRSGLDTGSIDCITTTDTLEHIPIQEIPAILEECHRILSPDGLMSFLVDYQDHYSYFDHNISAYNFLQYSDDQWAKYNSALHYQNRLRHRDYLALYEKARFDVISDRTKPISDADLELIAQLPVASRFKGYSHDDLAVRWSHIVLKKRC